MKIVLKEVSILLLFVMQRLFELINNIFDTGVFNFCSIQ